MAVKHDLAQIQIVPVEDGYFIQMINADGSGQKNPRHVASTRDELVTKLKGLIENLYTKDPPPMLMHPAQAPAITRTPPPETPPPDGNPKSQTPAGA